MSNIKMSERFGSVPNFDIKEFFEDDQMFAIPNVQSCYDDINKAVNNHDRLVEENKQQRESLDAFRELVKAQTKTIHDLNEENKRLSEGE
jgi:hypothetical protein